MRGSRPSESDVGVDRLVEAALKGDPREGITHLLKEIAFITGSFGCVLWRTTLDAQPPDQGEITMLAGWFDAENSFLGINRIPFKGTLTGKAVLEGWALDNDLTGNNEPYCSTPFFVRHSVNKAAGCCFKFLGGRLGVVMIYRKRDAGDFDEDTDIRRLKEISKVLPFLYNGARQKASYGLLKEIAEILREARKISKPGRPTLEANRNMVLRKVASALSKTFHSVETSVFLEDDNRPGTFTCAYTSDGPHSQVVRADAYQPTTKRGFSALCLVAREPIRVHDRLHPEMEVSHWQRRYPEFRGPESPDLAQLIIKYLGDPNPPPPLSLMVAPLVSDGDLLGFLRCWVARSGPSYFSSDDLALLRLVSDFLSQTLAAWKQERRALESRKRDYQAFRNFAQTGHAIGKKGDERDIYVAALGLVSEVIPEAAFTTIRRRRSDPDELYFYGYSISPRYGESSDGLAERLRKLPLLLPGVSLASVVVENKKLKLFRSTRLTKYPTDVSAEAGEMIIAPIVVSNRVEGVLDLRTCKNEKFSPQAQAVAGSVSTLLALQMAREKAEEERRRSDEKRFQTELQADRERAKADKAMRDAFEDVAHQIKSPLAEAARRVEESAERFTHSAVGQDLAAIATLLRRAELTAKLIGLFAMLAKGEQLTIRGTALTQVKLVQMASQICENQRPRVSASRNIRIDCDVDTFYKYVPSDFSVDPDLLIQALDNLVGNAVKYSYRNTTIRVFGAPLKRGGFFIGVTNKGIPIAPNEVHLVRQRNWRGEAAKMYVGEGNGLGLWIADHIMRAHGGELQVLPTRPDDGITEVRLAFPLAS